MSEQLKLHHLCLRVDNLKEAEVFYTGFLGLQTINRFVLPAKDAAVLLHIQADCHFLTLAAANGYVELFWAPGPREKAPVGSHFCLTVTHREELITRLQEAGVPLREVHWDERRIVFIEDPFGHLIEIKETET